METLKSEAAAAIGNFVRLEDSTLVRDDEHCYYDAEETVYKSDYSRMYDTEDCALEHPVPVAAATLLLEPLVVCAAADVPVCRLHHHSGGCDPADPTVDEVLSYSRPAFVFASALVTNTADKFGIFLKNLPTGGAYVARLAASSPFLHCNIAPGDHIVAVNHVLCSHLSAKQVCKLLHASTTSSRQGCGSVSICFHNPSGDPLAVSCSVQKPCPATKVGVFLRSKRGAIRVSRLDMNGLFGNSLLAPHHRCMRINGIACQHMTTRTAGNVIGAATDRVTIVSRPEANYALPIAFCGSPVTPHWRRSAALLGAGAGAGAAAVCVGVLSSLS
jgi:hypothetical protein